MSTFDFYSALEQYHRAAGEFVKGNPEPYKAVFSHQEDVTLGNPFGPFVRGWKQAAATMERAASLYRDGEIIGFENIAKHVTPELAYIVEVERIKARIGEARNLPTWPYGRRASCGRRTAPGRSCIDMQTRSPAHRHRKR